MVWKWQVKAQLDDLSYAARTVGSLLSRAACVDPTTVNPCWPHAKAFRVRVPARGSSESLTNPGFYLGMSHRRD